MKTLRLLLSALGLLCCLAFSASVHAASTIAVVDFQRALNEVKEGTTARAQLEAMFTEKKNAMTTAARLLGAALFVLLVVVVDPTICDRPTESGRWRQGCCCC